MTLNQEVRGNTLKVYLYILRHGSVELREVQRGVGLSTPSLASYHLGRLSEAGYVRQDEYGRYCTVEDASVKILNGYSKIGPAIVPQLFFFTVLFTILTAYFSYETLQAPGFTVYLIMASVAMVLTFWYETVRLWRKLAV
jgi:DNA-binding transcriptional ArsR family regulator